MRIAAMVADLLSSGATYTNRLGNLHAISGKDVLIITPYNVQAALLRKLVNDPDIEIGTVDKFQGKEAAIVIYSMASSSGDEAPRGLEFLYSLNRLNVATSRAEAVAILVASPALLNARCRTPRQLQLVNALCAFVEMAAT